MLTAGNDQVERLKSHGDMGNAMQAVIATRWPDITEYPLHPHYD
jgi:hypothetical protein